MKRILSMIFISSSLIAVSDYENREHQIRMEESLKEIKENIIDTNKLLKKILKELIPHFYDIDWTEIKDREEKKEASEA